MLRNLKQMDEHAIEDFAEQFLLIKIRVIKSPGILDDWTLEKRERQNPKTALK